MNEVEYNDSSDHRKPAELDNKDWNKCQVATCLSKMEDMFHNNLILNQDNISKMHYDDKISP